MSAENLVIEQPVENKGDKLKVLKIEINTQPLFGRNTMEEGL
jgi:hypothetical protein